MKMGGSGGGMVGVWYSVGFFFFYFLAVDVATNEVSLDVDRSDIPSACVSSEGVGEEEAIQGNTHAKQKGERSGQGLCTK